MTSSVSTAMSLDHVLGNVLILASHRTHKSLVMSIHMSCTTSHVPPSWLTSPLIYRKFPMMKAIDQTRDDARTVAMLRAIAHPARFRIVKLLAARQACVCGDLVDELPLAQSTVSEHLKVLKDAGIVRGTIEGPNTCYCLEPQAIAWLKREFGALSDACC